jgi:hypothetical protein
MKAKGKQKMSRKNPMKKQPNTRSGGERSKGNESPLAAWHPASR